MPQKRNANAHQSVRVSGKPSIEGSLRLRLRLAETNRAVARLELTALLQQLNAFEPLENVSLGGDGATAFETAMLGHDR
jgi:hypothetical protein